MTFSSSQLSWAPSLSPTTLSLLLLLNLMLPLSRAVHAAFLVGKLLLVLLGGEPPIQSGLNSS